MRPFKFFNQPDKIFPEWMDRMDDHILGNIPPREDIRDDTIIFQRDMYVYELGWSTAQLEREQNRLYICPYDIGTRSHELYMEGYNDRRELSVYRRTLER